MKRLSFLGVFLILGSLSMGLFAQEVPEILLEKTTKEKPRHAFAKLIPHDSEIARYMEWIFADQGISPPFQIYPISLEEIRYVLTKYVDRDKLSVLGKSLYDQVWAKTEETATWGLKDWVAIDPIVDVNLQLYALPNRDKRSWYFDYWTNRPGFLTLGFEVSLFDHWYTELAMTFRPDKLSLAQNPNQWTNSITLSSGLDMAWPQRAFTSISTPHFNIQGGRNVLNWGNGKSGNLMLSDAPGELNYLQVSTWWKFIKFTQLWTFLDNSRPELTDPNDPLSYKFLDANGTKYFWALTPDKVTPSKFFLAHRFDLKMGERMNLTFTEAVLYQDYWNNMGFLNPFYLFHNQYLAGHADYFLSIDIDVALTRGWTVYTQVLLDQVSAGLNRLSSSTKAIPGSIPVIVGTEVTHPLDRGYINWVAEFIKIDPYSYLDRSSVGLYMDKRWLTSAGMQVHLMERVPLGYYLGNDLMRAWTRLKWEEPFFYSVWLEGSALWKGENSLFTPWSDEAGEALKHAGSGKMISEYTVAIGGDINLSRWLSRQNLKFDTSIAYLNRHYQGKWSWDVQYSVGVEWFY